MTEETKRKYRETARKWYFANREKNLEKAKKWKRNNQRQVKAYQKKWRIENQEHKRQYQKKWYLANREQESANAKQRSRANPKKAQQIRKKAMEVRKTNPMYRLSDNMSRAIRRKLQSGKEGQSWQKLVGYTYKQLKRHLEKQFLPGMTWDNYDNYPIVSPHGLSPPAVTYPNGGETVKDTISITWNVASSSHGHTITYDVFYAIDDALNWILLDSE